MDRRQVGHPRIRDRCSSRKTGRYRNRTRLLWRIWPTNDIDYKCLRPFSGMQDIYHSNTAHQGIDILTAKMRDVTLTMDVQLHTNIHIWLWHPGFFLQEYMLKELHHKWVLRPTNTISHPTLMLDVSRNVSGRASDITDSCSSWGMHTKTCTCSNMQQVYVPAYLVSEGFSPSVLPTGCTLNSRDAFFFSC